MHIVQVINALRVGGAEKLIVTFARALQDSGHQLTVITLRQNVEATEQEVAETGARVLHFHHRKLFNPGRFLKLLKFLRSEPVDVIHTHLTMGNIVGGMAGYLAGIPVTTTLHNTKMGSEDRPLHHQVENWLLRNAVQRPIAVGWSIAEAHAERVGKELDVIPNAVPILPLMDEEERLAVRESLIDDPTACLLLAIGRLEPQKAFADLLDAFAEVQTTNPHSRLVIAGVGSLRTDLENQIAELGLSDTVQLLGLRHDVPQLMAAADIYVSSSHWEGLPVATLEALAAGLPCVVTKVGDVPEVVTSEMGILVEAKQPAELAAALQKLINDPALRQQLGQNGRQTAIDYYSDIVWVNKLVQLYTDIQPNKLQMERA